jgi:hypothetical protein
MTTGSNITFDGLGTTIRDHLEIVSILLRNLLAVVWFLF